MAVRKVKTQTGLTKWETQARDSQGGQHRRRFDRERDAKNYDRKLANEREEARLTGRRPHTSNLTLAEYTGEFLSSHVASPLTLQALKDRLAIATRSMGDVRLCDLDRVKIGRWVNLELAHYSTTTQRGVLKALRQALRRAAGDGLIASNPAAEVALPRLTAPPIKPFRSWAEVDLVAHHAGRWGPLIRFAARTGLRPQEWLAIKVGDINLASSRLHVRRTVRGGRLQEGSAKTRRSLRTIVLSAPAVDALLDNGLPNDPDALVFAHSDGSLINLHNWRARVWYRALETAQLERRGPKNLRHTFATLSLSQDPPIPIQDVQRQLGHADISVTLDFYTAFMPDQDDRLLRLLNSGAGVESIRAVA